MDHELRKFISALVGENMAQPEVQLRFLRGFWEEICPLFLRDDCFPVRIQGLTLELLVGHPAQAAKIKEIEKGF